MALERYVVAAVVLAGLLVPLIYYRNLAVSPTIGWRVWVSVQRLSGGAGRRPSGSGTSGTEAAQEKFALVLETYMRRHEAALALLDGPGLWGDLEAAAGLRLVVVQMRPQVRTPLHSTRVLLLSLAMSLPSSAAGQLHAVEGAHRSGRS
jgi:hypothetical protein